MICTAASLSMPHSDLITDQGYLHSTSAVMYAVAIPHCDKCPTLEHQIFMNTSEELSHTSTNVIIRLRVCLQNLPELCWQTKCWLQICLTGAATARSWTHKLQCCGVRLSEQCKSRATSLSSPRGLEGPPGTGSGMACVCSGMLLLLLRDQLWLSTCITTP